MSTSLSATKKIILDYSSGVLEENYSQSEYSDGLLEDNDSQFDLSEYFEDIDCQRNSSEDLEDNDETSLSDEFVETRKNIKFKSSFAGVQRYVLGFIIFRKIKCSDCLNVMESVENYRDCKPSEVFMREKDFGVQLIKCSLLIILTFCSQFGFYIIGVK